MRTPMCSAWAVAPVPLKAGTFENRVLRVLEGFESVWDLIAIRLRLRPHQAHCL